MRKLSVTISMLTCAAALCACQSPSPAAIAPMPQIPPLPQAIGTKREPNLTATAAALDAIAGDGDDATRQLNACIDAYNTVRDTYHVQTE